MTDPVTLSPATAAAIARLSGSPLEAARLAEVLAAFAPILEEIARLRALDLGDTHPAVVFDPSVPYRGRA